MTEEKFWLVKKLSKANCTHKEIAQAMGCKPSSVGKFKSYKTWEEYCEFKNKYAEKVRNKKQCAQEDLMEVVTNYKEPTLMGLHDMLEKKLDELIGATRQLIGWEERKQAQKEAYWAKQREQKRSYFNRWNNEQ